MRSKQGVGLITPTLRYQIDHLAPICTIMDIPLMVIEEEDYRCAKEFYPGLKLLHASYEQFTPKYLVENFEMIFVSEIWDQEKFRKQCRQYEEQFNKRVRHIFCPHGYSDKAFYFKYCAGEDFVLIYGQNMIDLLKRLDVLDKINDYAVVGNYRYTYYKKNREFYDKIALEQVFSKFQNKQKVILYAPTWRDQEDSSSYYRAISDLLDHLPDQYNMLVKLHPKLEENENITIFYQILGKYEGKKNVVFLNDFSPVYPLLAKSDIYIGDISSVGYDFLTFNRPMFFLNCKQKAYLYRCGVEITPEQYKEIYKIIDESLLHDQERFSKIRTDAYQYTFGKEQSFEEIHHRLETDLA